jgi:diacylglycerol kinase (ATP)
MKGSSEGKRRAIIILNGISLKKKLFYHEYLPAISDIYDVEVHETVSRNDGRILASRFSDQNVDLIVAAGGDGTLNQVVNGILKGREQEQNVPAVGLIPIGSGNDFARGVGLKTTVDHVVKTLSTFRTRAVDVGLVEYQTLPDGNGEKSFSYFVNVADIGMGPAVVGKVLSSGRPFGSGVAYYQSILTTFLTYKPAVVKAVTPDWTWEGKIRTLAVANGKYYGYGLCIAPEAVIDDGVFSVFICGNVSVLDFIMHTSTLKKGESVVMDEVLYKSARQLDFSSESPCPIEGDGEILGWLPARVSMTARQLKFLI